MSSSQQRASSIKLQGEQAEFLRYTGKQALLYGGFGGGKSRIGCEKVYKLNMKYPGNRALIVRKNFSDVRSSTIQQTLLEEVIPDSHYDEDMHNKSQHVIEHFTGKQDKYGQPITSEIYYEGLDSQGARSNDGLPRRISGMEFGTIFIDEATETTESDYVQLLGRLRYNGRTRAGNKYTVPIRQIIAATNPADPSHYLYQKFFDEEDEKERRRFHLRAEDNPGVDDDYVQQMKENYQGVFYERYVEGKWVGTEEVIYDEFDRRNYVLDYNDLSDIDYGWKFSEVEDMANQLTPPDDWNIYRSIDFGYPSPTTCQWWAVSPEYNPESEEDTRRYVMFRELYQNELLIDDAAELIKNYSKDLEVEQTFADPAQADNRETLRRNGIDSTAANKDVWNGIQATKSKMGREFGGHPQIVMYQDALIHPKSDDLDDQNKPYQLIDEFAKYEWADGKDEPIKEDDHGMDAMRYLIYSLTDGSGPSMDDMKEMAQALQNSF